MGLRPSHKADIALVGISAIWGCTFVLVKGALADISPFTFLAIRFLLAAAALAAVFREEIGRAARRAVPGGAVLGALLAAGFAFQTLGLLDTTPSRSAFITGLYVVGVPLLAAALGRRTFAVTSVAGVALALAGLYLMTAAPSSSPAGTSSALGRGEILTLACAMIFAGHIVGVDIFTRRAEARALAFWQILIAGLLCVPLALLAERPRVAPTASLAFAVVVTSLGGTALAFAVQNAVQAKITPTRAAIIFTSEPVFAGITSWLVAGERLPPVALLGAALILAGMIASEIPSARADRAPGAATG